MKGLHSRPFRRMLNRMYFEGVCCAVLIVLLASCSPRLPVQREAHQAREAMPAAPYSIVCIIHGDGSYLYHDTGGVEYKADEEALAGAKKVAEQNPQAEVFIFHQKPKRHFLFFFPIRDGEFYYYRNGSLIAKELYWRDEVTAPLDVEVELYRGFRPQRQRETVNIFLYFGHAIPEFGGFGYDASYPDRKFTVDSLAVGMSRFKPHSATFDLLVLSTCYGGTPYTIGKLGPFARTVIASPGNLHLSYFDVSALERLDLHLEDGHVSALAQRLALQAFDRLTSDIQTAVTVAVYDVDRVQEFLSSVQDVYVQTLTTLQGETRTSLANVERCDCADIPEFVQPAMNKGIDVWFRSARFGRSKYKQNHSGWECWREK